MVELGYEVFFDREHGCAGYSGRLWVGRRSEWAAVGQAGAAPEFFAGWTQILTANRTLMDADWYAANRYRKRTLVRFSKPSGLGGMSYSVASPVEGKRRTRGYVRFRKFMSLSP